MKHVIQSIPFYDTIIVQLKKDGHWYLFLQDFVMHAKSRDSIVDTGEAFINMPNLGLLDRQGYTDAIEEYVTTTDVIA